MQDRAHVRFAQARELGDGAVRGFGSVLQRDDLLLALRAIVASSAPSRARSDSVESSSCGVLRRGDLFRRLERQMRPLRAPMIGRDVARDR